MATFPLVTTPTPDEWVRLMSRQITSSPFLFVTFGFAFNNFNWRSFWLDLHIVKDGTAGGVSLTLNAGAGGVDYIPDQSTGAAILNIPAGLAQPALPLTLSGAAIAANRDGSWSIWIAQGEPNDAVIIGTGGYFRNTSAVQCVADVFAVWNMSGAKITGITVSSLAGNFAANSALVLTGEGH